MNIYFSILGTIHILIWSFVLLAFLNKTLAKINLYFVIPSIYFIHLLPFHILETLKSKIYNNNQKIYYTKKLSKILVIPYYFDKLSTLLSKYCFFNPISPQGMLIFGLITCIYRLYPPNLKKIFNFKQFNENFK